MAATDDVAKLIEIGPGSGKPVGTTGAGADTAAVLTDVTAIARGDHSLVGRRVDLENVKVSRRGDHHGFWVESGGASVFVLPAAHAQGSRPAPVVGQTVSIEGLIMQTPRAARAGIPGSGRANESIYVYATELTN